MTLTLTLCDPDPDRVPAPTDLDSNGSISAFELHDLFKEANLPLPGFRVREIIQRLDRNNDNLISFDEFVSVCPVVFLTSPALRPSSGRQGLHSPHDTTP